MTHTYGEEWSGRAGLRELAHHIAPKGIGALVMVPRQLIQLDPHAGQYPKTKGEDGIPRTDVLVGHSLRYEQEIDRAILMALALSGPSLIVNGRGGTGSHIERDDAGVITLDLMSSDPEALVDRIGPLSLLRLDDGWTENRNHDSYPDGPPLNYWHSPQGGLQVVGSVVVGFGDLVNMVREEADPPMAHFRGSAASHPV